MTTRAPIVASYDVRIHLRSVDTMAAAPTLNEIRRLIIDAFGYEKTAYEEAKYDVTVRAERVDK